MEEDVVWFEVAMNDMLRMQITENEFVEVSTLVNHVALHEKW